MENFSQNNENLNFEKVWLMFQETGKRMDARDKEFERKMIKRDEEFEKQMAKRDKEVTKRINKLEELFTSQWGKLIETLVDGDLVNLLKNFGIEVMRTSQREKGIFNNKQYEFDIIAKNGTDIVVVEVKTTLRVKHIKEFTSKLKDFKEVMPEYGNKNILGAIAFLQADERSELYAQKLGLFVIKATGNSASIINKEDFKPKAW